MTDQGKEAEREAAAINRKKDIKTKLAAKDWASLDLPTPHELLTNLQNGERCDVGGHKLTPDEHGVWITGPYGNDCSLMQELNIEVVEQFLTDMAHGDEYGPVPN